MTVIAFNFTHPITRTIGGYTYQALPADATTPPKYTTHTLLTNPTTHYMASDGGILSNNPNTWIPYSSTITKTIYDPCPYGYRVPINGSWTGFPKNIWIQYAITGGASWPDTNGGWWPAAGNRGRSSALLYDMSLYGHYWSSSRHATAHLAYFLYFLYNGTVSLNNNVQRSFGMSVRCIEGRRK